MPAARERRGARPLHLWQKIPDQPEGRQVRQLGVVDKRTQLGRVLKAFKRDLVQHVTEKNGRPPDAVEQALIESCCALKIKLAYLEKKIIERADGDLEQRSYIAWSNTFRRQLAALNYSEQANIIRKNSEARLLREYNR
jgi:hypothetical protein